MNLMYGFWIDESFKEITESSQNPIIAVGGFYIPIQLFQYCISEWRALKQSYGIDENSEVKWNLPSKHPTRNEIALKKINYWNFRISAMEMINSWQFLFCVVSILKDRRDQRLWRMRNFRTSCTDFYIECLKFTLQRIAEESENNNWGYCQIICDRFSLGKNKIEFGAIRKGPNIIQKYYNEFYRSGVGGGPFSIGQNHPLKELGFHPSIIMSDASYDDLIQIADFIVSCSSDWVFDTLSNSTLTFSNKCMKIIAPRFRNTLQIPLGFFRDGLILFPFDDTEVAKLKSSLE